MYQYLSKNNSAISVFLSFFSKTLIAGGSPMENAMRKCYQTTFGGLKREIDNG